MGNEYDVPITSIHSEKSRFFGQIQNFCIVTIVPTKNRKKARDMKTSFSKGANNDSVITDVICYIRKREIQFF